MTEIEQQFDVVREYRMSGVSLTLFHSNQSQSNALKYNQNESHVPFLSVHREH